MSFEKTIFTGIGLACVWVVCGVIWAYFNSRQSVTSKIDVGSMAVKSTLMLTLLSVVSLCYFVLYQSNLQYTGLMFVGIPSIIAAWVILSRVYSRPYLATFVGITLFLLISFVVFGEGYICILMTAPIYYVFGALHVFLNRFVYVMASRTRSVVLMTLLASLFAFEGVIPTLTHQRIEETTHSETIALSEEQVLKNLGTNPNFSQLPIHMLSRIGMPVPVTAVGQGLNVGDIRQVIFRRFDGVTEQATFSVTQRNDHAVELTPLEDETIIGNWLRWKSVRYEWLATESDQTTLTVTLQYERRLDPIWYFKPVQRWGAAQAAKVLIAHAKQSSDG